MKNTIVYLLLIAMSMGFAQSYDMELESANGSKYLVGQLSKEALLKEPYANWFNARYASTSITKGEIEELKPLLSDIKIMIFLGTWCGDSKKQVPAFLKILDRVEFPRQHLKMVALDRSKERYKQSPGGEEWGLNIKRVPTFIFLKNGREINRIVERPKNTLIKDMLTILNNGDYLPHYENASGTD